MAVIPKLGSAAITLQAAYNGGNTIAVAGNLSVAISGTQANPLLELTGTASTTGSVWYGQLINMAGAGTSAARRSLFGSVFTAGYTGSQETDAAYFSNANAGTAASSFNNSIANYGVTAQAVATTTGHNVGTGGAATGGNLNVGAQGFSIADKASATSIGVLGIARNNGASAVSVGGFFGLNASAPTYASAALMADNGDSTANIFTARDNGTAIFTLADGGPITHNVNSASAGYSLTQSGAGAIQEWFTAGAVVMASLAGVGTFTLTPATDVRGLVVSSAATTASDIYDSSTTIRLGGTTNSQVVIRNTNASSTGGILYVSGASNASASVPMTTFQTSNPANDQPTVRIIQGGTGAAQDWYDAAQKISEVGAALTTFNSLPLRGHALYDVAGSQLIVLGEVNVGGGNLVTAISSRMTAAQIGVVWALSNAAGNDIVNLSSFDGILLGSDNADTATNLGIKIFSGAGGGAYRFFVNGGNGNTYTPLIMDINSNEVLKFTGNASAVNELTLANAATGTNPILSATGGDTNIGITLTPKGSGQVQTNNLKITGGGSFSAWTTTGVGFSAAAATFTDTSSSGTVADTAFYAFGQPTIAASSATTYTRAATVYIANAPVAGANATTNDLYALFVDNGLTRLDGNVGIGGNPSGAAKLKITTAMTSSGAVGVAGSALQIETYTHTNTGATGTIATWVANGFAGLTIARSGANTPTYTDAANVYISGANIAGTGVTITRNYALWVDADLSRFDGGIAIDGSVTKNVLSGVYSPTRSAEANMDANVTITQCQYMQVGNTVTVSGQFTADPTLTATSTSFEMTLPVASNIGATDDCAGVAFCGAIAGMGAQIAGVVANDTAQIKWVASDVTSQSWYFTFTYQVI